MREIRQSGSEGGEVMSLLDPYLMRFKQPIAVAAISNLEPSDLAGMIEARVVGSDERSLGEFNVAAMLGKLPQYRSRTQFYLARQSSSILVCQVS